MNPEIDKLASAAIDDEATPQELARYEGDAAFLAAKSQLSAASEFVAQAPVPSAPAGLAQAQISVAMDQFRADAAQRAVLAAQPVSSAKPNVVKESRWAFPRWFTPAIFSIAVLGGLGLAAQNFSSSSGDESATATTAAGEADAADGGALMADAAAMEEGADAERAAAGSAETTEAMAGDDGALDAPTDVEAADGFVFETPGPIDLTGARFVANENLAANRVATLAKSEPPVDPELYDRCGIAHGFFAPPGELVLVVPFTRNGEPAEVLVYDTGQTGGRTALIVNESCEVLSES